jgi:hypothetical protein
LPRGYTNERRVKAKGCAEVVVMQKQNKTNGIDSKFENGIIGNKP